MDIDTLLAIVSIEAEPLGTVFNLNVRFPFVELLADVISLKSQRVTSPPPVNVEGTSGLELACQFDSLLSVIVVLPADPAPS